MTDSRDASNMNPRSRESPPNGFTNTFTNGYTNGMMLNDKHHLSDDEENANRKRACDSHGLSYGFSNEKTFSDNNVGLSPAKNSDKIRGKEDILVNRNGSNNSTVLNGRINEDERSERSRWNSVTSSTQHRITRVSPDSQSERISATDSGPPPINTLQGTSPEFPDYLT